MNNIVENLLSLPKTLYTNFKLFPFSIALKFPFKVSYKTKLVHLEKNTVNINGKISRGIIRFGFHGSEGLPGDRRSHLIIHKGSKVTFQGKAVFSEGCTLRVSGDISFGENFFCNKYSYISCGYKVSFGNDVLIGWNTVFRDNDGHTIIDSQGNEKPHSKEVNIGNHTWIGAFSHVLRSSVGDDCVVAWRSCVVKSIMQNGCIIGGYPAKIIEENISWK